MTRPRIYEWPYADADQQEEPVPDVPLIAVLVAVVWRLRWWIGIVVAAALLALGVVYGAWRLG